MKRIILIVGILIFGLLVCGYIIINSEASKVTITDVYCDNNGSFVFTVVNSQLTTIDLTYKWHLDNPKANLPEVGQDTSGAYTGYNYTGNGSVNVPGNSSIVVVVPIPPDSWYSLNNLIMDVELFKDNTSIYHYREQKSPYYWDYSSLPPKPKT